MADVVEALVLDLLEWIGNTPRPYREVMEAWRTSCPRLPVWETANERGFLEYRHRTGQHAVVLLSASGRAEMEAGRLRRLALHDIRATDKTRPRPRAQQEARSTDVP